MPRAVLCPHIIPGLLGTWRRAKSRALPQLPSPGRPVVARPGEAVPHEGLGSALSSVTCRFCVSPQANPAPIIVNTDSLEQGLSVSLLVSFPFFSTRLLYPGRPQPGGRGAWGPHHVPAAHPSPEPSRSWATLSRATAASS